MLEIDTDVLKGFVVIGLKGVLNKNTISEFNRELNYLFYKQGFNYYIFDFRSIDRIEFDVFSWLDNKLMEIFLSCGKAIVYGLEERYKGNFNRFKYLREENQDFNFVTI